MRFLIGAVLSAVFSGLACAAGIAPSYAEVRGLLAGFADRLPQDLSSTWPSWISQHDRDIRARLTGGDADTIVNWLVFGTTFTAHPRVVLDRQGDPAEVGALLQARARDLVAALAAPGTDERRLFARTFLEQAGHRVDTAAARGALERHLIAEVVRVAREQDGHRIALEAARRKRSGADEFAARSTVFKDRGVSLDTSLLPGLGLERALAQMIAGGFLKPGTIRRVAVAGPGLDFADKDAGYDFYPQQTLQPFALIDTLLRLRLSDASTLSLTTLDISPRVNDHLRRARERAADGSGYTLQLPLEQGAGWKPEVVDYWKRVGSAIGTADAGSAPRGVSRNLTVRTLRVRPETIARITVEDLNLVTGRLDGPPFDLIVATNMFVYYDELDQSLALMNVAAMLRPGSFLLANESLPEIPAVPMRTAGYVTVQYADDVGKSDHIVWYRRQN